MDYLKFKKYILKIKSTLLSKKNREFLIFLFFLLVSASFWILQSLNETYDIELRFPLKIKDVPENIVITDELPEEVRTVVRDKGTVLIRYLYGSTISPIVVDYDDYDEGLVSGRVCIPSPDVNKKILSQLISSTKIISMKPDTLDFYFNRGSKKKVPVRLMGKIETSPEYYLQKVRCQPDSVYVYAPLYILDTITTAYTNAINVTDLNKNIDGITRGIREQRGVKYEPSSVDIYLSVDLYTEKTVEVPVVGVNFPAAKDLRTFPSKVKVSFKVGMSKFKEIGPEDFVITISYEELMNEADSSSKVKLKLKSMPPGVSNVKIYPSEVDYLIEQNEEEGYM